MTGLLSLLVRAPVSHGVTSGAGEAGSRAHTRHLGWVRGLEFCPLLGLHAPHWQFSGPGYILGWERETALGCLLRAQADFKPEQAGSGHQGRFKLTGASICVLHTLKNRIAAATSGWNRNRAPCVCTLRRKASLGLLPLGSQDVIGGSFPG